MNHKSFMEYIRTDADRIILFSGRSPKQIKSILGDASIVKIFEYRNWIWAFEIDGYIFQVLSSVQGTTYEVLYNGTFEEFVKDNKISSSIRRFLKYIEIKLSTIK